MLNPALALGPGAERGRPPSGQVKVCGEVRPWALALTSGLLRPAEAGDKATHGTSAALTTFSSWLPSSSSLPSKSKSFSLISCKRIGTGLVGLGELGDQCEGRGTSLRWAQPRPQLWEPLPRLLAEVRFWCRSLRLTEAPGGPHLAGGLSSLGDGGCMSSPGARSRGRAWGPRPDSPTCL